MFKSPSRVQSGRGAASFRRAPKASSVKVVLVLVACGALLFLLVLLRGAPRRLEYVKPRSTITHSSEHRGPKNKHREIPGGARINNKILSLDGVEGSRFCPVPSPHGLCDDDTQALQARVTPLRSEMYFRTSTVKLSYETNATSAYYTPLRCHNDAKQLRGGLFATNGVGFAGGTVSACPRPAESTVPFSEERKRDDADASSSSERVGDVDSFIVAVRTARIKSSSTGSAQVPVSRVTKTPNEKFRYDILLALNTSFAERNDHASTYHHVLHSSQVDAKSKPTMNRGGDAGDREGVDNVDAAASDQEGEQEPSTVHLYSLDRVKGDESRAPGGSTSVPTYIWNPLVVDAVVTFVDGLAPGFAQDLANGHWDFGVEVLCHKKPPDGIPDDYNHTWRKQFKATKAENKFGLTRWRNWGELRYCLRGIFRHGGMHRGGGPSTNRHFRYRRIFLVMNSLAHTPSWLRKKEIGNTGQFVYEEQPGVDGDSEAANVPLLTLVPHSAFIPKCILPTFSSQGIEPFLNRIPGISRWFVYINEDTLLSRRLSLLDYFQPLPPVRQDAKAHHLKMKYGADVFDSIVPPSAAKHAEDAAADSHAEKHEVVFLEPSLYAERRIGAWYVFKKNIEGAAFDDLPIDPNIKTSAPNKKLKETLKTLSEPEQLAARLRRRAARYDAYTTMLKRQIVAIEAEGKMRDQKVSTPPLRPAAFFDVGCKNMEENGKADHMAMIQRRIATDFRAGVDGAEGAEDSKEYLSVGDMHTVPFAPRGFFTTAQQTCFNAYILHKKLDGIEPFYYFPHISPLFDGYMLQRLVGAPLLSEEQKDGTRKNAESSQRGYFEEEFLGRTVFNELRRMTDAVVPMLYQPFAAAQRRYLSEKQFAQAFPAEAVRRRSEQAERQIAALHDLVDESRALKDTSLDVKQAVEKYIKKHRPPLSLGSGETKANAAKFASQVKMGYNRSLVPNAVKILEGAEARLDAQEERAAERAVNQFGPRYFLNSDIDLWFPPPPESSPSSRDGQAGGNGAVTNKPEEIDAHEGEIQQQYHESLRAQAIKLGLCAPQHHGRTGYSSGSGGKKTKCNLPLENRLSLRAIMPPSDYIFRFTISVKSMKKTILDIRNMTTFPLFTTFNDHSEFGEVSKDQLGGEKNADGDTPNELQDQLDIAMRDTCGTECTPAPWEDSRQGEHQSGQPSGRVAGEGGEKMRLE